MHPLKFHKEIMKKMFLAVLTVVFGMANAQTDAFRGAGDTRYQIGMNIQDGGTGVMTSLDYGLGESFSIGAQQDIYWELKNLMVLANLLLATASTLKPDSTQILAVF